MALRRKQLGTFIFVLLWTLLVLYPRPAELLTSMRRLLAPPVDPQAVEKIIFLLPSKEDPALVEKFILQEFPYLYDWQNFNLPWYFPTAEEAMEKGGGDCKTRFIILASTLEALGISYETFISPSHIWVYYEGKKDSGIENKEAALIRWDGEKLSLKVPEEVSWPENLEIFYEAFWLHMPLRKKITLLCGFIFAFYLLKK